jgi:peptidoglycan/xylan/chitin deacetylase (PgdA/CDA1 family)
MIQSLKRTLVRSSFSLNLFTILTRKIVPRVLVYHRFCKTATNSRHIIDASTFEWQLQQIVKLFKVITFGEYLKLRINREKIPQNIVILTIDDGYRDFYEIAYPIIKKMNLSATFFSTVNFISRKIWLWPDRISYALDETSNTKFTYTLGKKVIDCDLSSSESAFKVWKLFSDYCIKISDEKKWELIKELEKFLCVCLPKSPPSEYSAVTWEQLAEMSKNGIEIGSHTLNHPILSKIKEENLYDEINLSKTYLEDKLCKEIVSFCYPNSAPDDINKKVIEQVKKAKYKGAVFGLLPGNFDDLYSIPRISAESDRVNFLWKLSGMESVVEQIRLRAPI